MTDQEPIRPAEQGESPIDFVAADDFHQFYAMDEGLDKPDPLWLGRNASRAYLALRADQQDWRKGVGLIASSLGEKTLSCSHLSEKAFTIRAERDALAAEVERLRGEILQECAEAICIYCAARLPEWAAAPKPNALGRWFHPLNDTHRGPDALCLAEAIHAKKEARNDR